MLLIQRFAHPYGSLLMLLIQTSFVPNVTAANYSQDAYASVLQEFVNEEGRVDYAELKQDPQNLNKFLDSIAQVKAEDFQQWPLNEQMAFWINSYNAYTLKAIIDRYPIQASFFDSLRFPKNSIRQIDGVWDQLKFTVMGQPMTLNQIEHDTLRAKYDEPRIHFALNCASIGCPVLRREPYEGDKLEDQLTEQVIVFMNDANKFKVVPDKGVYISQLLQWYGEDFVQKYGTEEIFAHLDNKTERAVMNFFYPFFKEELKEYVESNDFDIEYLKYDWSLNEKKK